MAHTIKLGLRGHFAPYDHAQVTWSVSAYRTNLDDDIIFAQSTVRGAGFFQNVGSTRRQGFEHLRGIKPKQSGGRADGNIIVVPGDQLPGIPANILKLGVQYEVMDKWTVGITAVATSGQYLFGDEANLTKRLPGYFLLNLNTSYQVTPKVGLFALVQNASVPIVQVPGATNTRRYNIGAPIAAYGGLKVLF